MNSTIALCASLASSNIEGPRGGGKALREGAAVKNAMLAVALAQSGHVAGDTVLEGDAGFYHAYAGNNKGQLSYSFVGDTHANLDSITANLGKDWMFLETLYRIYYTAGYNIAHIDVPAAMCKEHNIKPEDVERVDAVVNWIETQYPSPAFPSRREDGEAKPGTTAYFTAYGIVKRGYPVTRGQPLNFAEDPPGSAGPDEAREHHPVAQDDALRPALHDLHEGREELHEAVARDASSSGTTTGSRAASRTSPRGCRFPRRSTRRSSRPAAISTRKARADALVKLTLQQR